MTAHDIHAAAAAMPAGIASGVHALRGLAGLLRMVDPQRWASMARPEAEDLSDLVGVITASILDGVSELTGTPT